MAKKKKTKYKNKVLAHTVIGVPGILDVFKLPSMFHKAVNEDYAFYDDSVRKLILERNSLWHLLTARINPKRIILTGNKKGSGHIGIILAAVNSDGVGIVNWLYVLPKYRKKGIAHMLLSEVEKKLLQRGCHKLVVSTEIAYKFYRKIGYAQEGKLKNHWWGKDFYIFSKFLK